MIVVFIVFLFMEMVMQMEMEISVEMLRGVEMLIGLLVIVCRSWARRGDDWFDFFIRFFLTYFWINSLGI